MRAARYGLLAAGILTIGSGAAQAQGQSCTRACLEDVLNRYMAAVVAHNPAAAPLGTYYRETDNTMVTAPGDGVWKSITGFGKLQRHYMDPVTGGVGFYGTLREGDQGAIATVRLLVENRKVIEAEWIVGHADSGSPMAPGPGLTSVEGAEQTPPPTTPIPRDKRLTRRELIAATNAYFDYAQSGNEALLPAAPNWVRLENGMGTGEGLGGMARGGKGLYPGREAARRAGTMQGGVAPLPPGGLKGICPSICNVAARRYPIVDEEMGTVLGIVVFQRPPANTFRRNLLSEWFRFENGKMTGVYASMEYVNPTQAAPNWPPYDGNFPLSFNVGISPTPTPPAPPGAMPPGLLPPPPPPPNN